MKPCTFGLIIFLFIIIWEPGLTYGGISLLERDALETLYNKTGGRNWFHQENWKKAPGTENTWYGITCDAANSTVLKIELSGNNLHGVLAADMEAFSNLTTLDLSHNRLTGEIPHWLEKLKNLKKLDLSNNNFTGSIPTWIGKLKNLEELLLDNNRLDGVIPKELAKLTNLKILRLGSNRLTDEIPAELDKLYNLNDNQSNFKWNGLYTQKIDLKNFLKKKQIDGDWESTQTIAPSDIKVVDFTEDTITINWQPIPYTADTGGYQVFYRKEGQYYDYRYIKYVKNKTVSEVSLKGLDKSTRYHFKIRTWTDGHRMNINRIESPFSNEFHAATRGIIISGTIRNKKDDEGIAGVQITASNGGGTVTTDKDGKYKLSIIPGWTGIVTPFKEGFKFSPPSINYDREVTEDIGINDYTTEYGMVISGKVTFKGKGIGDVILKFTGENGENYIALTDENGNYEKEVSYNWSGSVIPIKSGYQFNPKEKKYTKVTSRHEEQNYEVQLQKIFGKVKNFRGKGISGIKMKFSNIEKDKFKYLEYSAVTDEKGNYEIYVLDNWTGIVTPESSQKAKYFFYPPSRGIKNFEDTKRALNFKAWRNFKFFFSITGNYIGTFNYTSNSSDHIAKFIYAEITGGFKFSRKFYIFSGIGFIVSRLKFDVSKKTGWIQQSSFLGIGSYNYITPYINLISNVGVIRFRYKESFFVEKISAMAWGFRLENALIFNINDRWFTEIPVGFLISKKAIYVSMGLRLGYKF